MDFESHQFASTATKPTKPPKGAPGPAPKPNPNPNPGPDPGPKPAPTGKLEPGHHLWEYQGLVSQSEEIPRMEWFKKANPNDKTDYQGHGKEISNWVVYPDHLKRGRPHMRRHPGTFAWLNNNPGNLTAGGAAVGEYPGKRNWHGFLIFPTPEAGFDAIPKFLKANRYYPMSIEAALERYAPKKDGNDPERYARSVVDALGPPVTLQTKLQDLTEAQMVEVQKAIREMEGVVKGDVISRDDPGVPPAIRERL